MGFVFAQNHRAYQRWTSSRVSSRKRAPMSDQQLEAAIMGIAAQFPGQVQRVIA